MKEKLRIFLNFSAGDRQILISQIAALLVNIIIWILIASKFGISKDVVPLHFSVVYGINFVGAARQLYELPAAGLVILIVNSLLTPVMRNAEPLFAYFLSYASLAVQIILLIGALSLVVLSI